KQSGHRRGLSSVGSLPGRWRDPDHRRGRSRDRAPIGRSRRPGAPRRQRQRAGVVDLAPLADAFQRRFEQTSAAREKALVASRRSIRASANAIRAVHRGDLDQAGVLMEESRQAIHAGRTAVRDAHPEVYFAGFLQDAQKEYAEARLTLALVTGAEAPPPDDLEVELAPYLNGMAESIGDGRRASLDLPRRGEVETSERILRAMEDMYDVLVSSDFPDAIPGNLR